MSNTDEWLSSNSGGNNNPGVYFGTPGDKVVGQIDGTPRAVTTEFGERLVVDLIANDGCTAYKGTGGEGGPIEPGETVTLWIKPGAMASAVRNALSETGAKGLASGDTLAVAYTADGERRKPGQNPPKLYAAQYMAAKPAVSVDNLI